MADITLSTAVRSNLLALQRTTGLIDRTQGRLATGLAISSPVDDAVKFFQGKALSNRAADLSDRKSAIDQGVSTLETALQAADAIESLTEQLKGIIDSARSGSTSQRAEFAKQLREVAKQIEKLVNDATYQGLNLLNSTSSKLSVRFSDKTDSKLDVDGVDFQSSAYFLDSAGAAIGAPAVSTDAVVSGALGFDTTLSAYNFDDAVELASFNARADVAVTRIEKTIGNLQAKAASLANNVAILQVRSDFTQEYVNVLDSGAGKLTVADLNEEGANLLALQTRQQLGIQALAFAGQSEQSILGLFR
ncbi:MAG: flagellin [Hyphomicrobiales bacterium]|nr:flagellin [Hyphomicrobiales bacterium]